MDHNQTFTIRDAIEGVFRRKLLVAFLFLVILAIVGVSTLTATKVYESQAKVFVRLGRENVGLDPTSTLGEGTVVATPMSREAEINSVVHLIRNRDLYERVVEKFGAEQILRGLPPGSAEHSPNEGFSISGMIKKPLQDAGVFNKVAPRERAILRLQKKLEVKALDHSNVIMISYECESPKLAKDVVDFLLNQYVDLHLKLHRPSGALEFLKKETTNIRSSLTDREAKLEAFKTESGMVSSELQKQSYVQRISSLESQLRDSQVKVAALDLEVQTLETYVKDILANNSMYKDLRVEQIKKAALLEAEKQRVDKLEKQLAREEAGLAEFIQDERKFLDLTRQLQIHDENYRRYERNLAQASLDDALEESKVSNISISQGASYNEKPVRPNKLVNLIVGLLLATVGSTGTAVLLAYLKPETNRISRRSLSAVAMEPNGSAQSGNLQETTGVQNA